MSTHAIGLGVLCGGLLAVMVVRTESTTVRPGGTTLIGAVAWRGVSTGRGSVATRSRRSVSACLTVMGDTSKPVAFDEHGQPL